MIRGFASAGRPEKSVILLAPLAKEAGGYGKCIIKDTGRAVFESTDDAGHRAILSMCVDGTCQCV